MSATVPAEETTSPPRRWYTHGAFVVVVGVVLITFLPGALFGAIAQPNNDGWIWLAAAVILGGVGHLGRVGFRRSEEPVGRRFPTTAGFRGSQEPVGRRFPTTVGFRRSQEPVGRRFPTMVGVRRSQKPVGRRFPTTAGVRRSQGADGTTFPDHGRRPPVLRSRWDDVSRPRPASAGLKEPVGRRFPTTVGFR